MPRLRQKRHNSDAEKAEDSTDVMPSQQAQASRPKRTRSTAGSIANEASTRNPEDEPDGCKSTGKRSRKRKKEDATHSHALDTKAALKDSTSKKPRRQRNTDWQNGKSSSTVVSESQESRQTPKRMPSIKKEPSESASIALREISKLVHRESSDSEDSEKAPSSGSMLKMSDASDDEDDMFEDIDINSKPGASAKFEADEEEEETNELSLTLEKAERIQLAKTSKKKQSVRAVHERAFTHYMSLVAMVAVGAWRNMWINDPKLHTVLRNHFRTKAPSLHKQLTSIAKDKQMNSVELVELLGRVMYKWHYMFCRTSPGLRRLGYRQTSQMDAGEALEKVAETFTGIDQFIKQAKLLKGSRDYGAQLFTALLRAYHFKVRLIFSTQPLGYKFNEREEFSQTLAKSLVELSLPEHEDGISGQDMGSPTRTTKSLRKERQKKRTGSKNDAIRLDDESDLSDLGSQYSIDPDLWSDNDERAKSPVSGKNIPRMEVDSELEYPVFWTEVFDSDKRRWIAIDSMVKRAVFVDEKGFKSLHPKGLKAEQQKLSLGFVIAYDANRYAKDVTTRYASSWAKVKDFCLRADGKTNTRYDANKILINMGNPWRDAQEREEDDLLAFKEYKRPPIDEMPKNLADFKSSPKYILEKHLREKDAFKPNAKHVDIFTAGKGSKMTTSRVFLRADVIPCKTTENYHKEGRKIKIGEQPRKMIKARAMTTNRIREHQQQLAETGEEHVMQGIYSLDQTEYIIPPPIKNGVIPKNSYGNADVFVESMIPVGATHLRLKGVARIARKLEIDHAEAVVGFEFKARGAIPVVLGVLVADENAERLRTAWEEAEEIRLRKEDKKRSDAALKTWARFLKGLRIRSRINAEYGIPVAAETQTPGEMTVVKPKRPKTIQERNEEALEEEKDEEVIEDGGFLRA